MKELSETYQSIVITYDERDNKWKFELRGRECSAPSLREARSKIDAPPPKQNDKPPFERVEAWLHWYSNDFKRVTVTSIAEGGYVPYVWVVSKEEGRRKQRPGEVFPCNPHNDALVAQHAKINQQIAALAEQRNTAFSKMKCLEIK